MKNIVIIGGGFAGSHAAKELEKSDKFSVTLIDKKEYFEFTPSILKVIANSKHLSKIQSKYEEYLKRTNFVCGEVVKISRTHVHLKTLLEKIPYDYLVIATGSSYALPFKDHQTLQINRGEEIKKNQKELAKSKKVLIIGGGIVGIELAGEIADKYPDKKIEIIQANKSLIPRNSKKSQEYSKKVLKEKGVRITTNKRFEHKGPKHKKDEELVFICTGIKPNINFKLIPKDNFMETNQFLQLTPQRNVFIVGDVSNIKEEKTAQNAIRQANTAITNIKRLEKNKKLKPYTSKKTPQIISLGQDKGIFESKNFVIKGKLPIILKNAIEKKEMKKLRS